MSFHLIRSIRLIYADSCDPLYLSILLNQFHTFPVEQILWNKQLLNVKSFHLHLMNILNQIKDSSLIFTKIGSQIIYSTTN